MHAKQVLSILSLLFAAIAPAFAQDVPNQKSLPTQLVDALNGVFGKQTDNRAAHAKGIVLEGKFTPSAEAATLSKAPHLQSGTTVPITVRFSDFAGVPTMPAWHGSEIPSARRLEFRPGDALL